jgi:hypothetical protein
MHMIIYTYYENNIHTYVYILGWHSFQCGDVKVFSSIQMLADGYADPDWGTPALNNLLGLILNNLLALIPNNLLGLISNNLLGLILNNLLLSYRPINGSNNQIKINLLIIVSKLTYMTNTYLAWYTMFCY